MSQDMQKMGPTLVSTATSEQPSRQLVLTLSVLQHPEHGRMSGFGEKDHRPLDPPAVLRLEMKDSESGLDRSAEFEGAPLMIMARLVSEDGVEARDQVYHPLTKTPTYSVATRAGDGRPIRNLLGDVCLHPRIMTLPSTLLPITAGPTVDEKADSESTALFVFSDLSVRAGGTYRLQFDLVDMSMPEFQWPDTIPTHTEVASNVDSQEPLPLISSFVQPSSAPIAFPISMTVYSNIFTVYQPKRFPGLLNTTALSRELNQQGIKIPVRSSGSKSYRHREQPSVSRKQLSKEDNNDADVGER